MTDLQQERYGRRRRARWPIALAAVIVVAFLGWLAWAIWAESNPEVTSAQISFDIVNAHEATSTVEIKLRSTDVKATCDMQATAKDHSTVGEIRFVVPQDHGTTVSLTRTVRTARLATTVEWNGCTAPGQARPR